MKKLGLVSLIASAALFVALGAVGASASEGKCGKEMKQNNAKCGKEKKKMKCGVGKCG